MICGRGCSRKGVRAAPTGSPDHSNSQSLWLVMEYCGHGTLQVGKASLKAEPMSIVCTTRNSHAARHRRWICATCRKSEGHADPCRAEGRIAHVRACAESNPESLVPRVPLGGRQPALLGGHADSTVRGRARHGLPARTLHHPRRSHRMCAGSTQYCCPFPPFAALRAVLALQSFGHTRALLRDRLQHCITNSPAGSCRGHTKTKEDTFF